MRRNGYAGLVLAVIALAACQKGESSGSSGTETWSNPIIKSIYTADAAAMVHDDTVYLYVGHDTAAAGATSFVMPDWYCYSSTDMIHWKSHGTPLSEDSFTWCNTSANASWASQVIERNGYFYWYVTVQVGNVKAIGVAKSTSPTGPFTDAKSSALITAASTTTTSSASTNTYSWEDIDPTVFIDDDGQAYLYWGNSNLFYVKLNSDMISYDTTTGIVCVTSNNSTDSNYVNTTANTSGETPLTYTEGPWLHKHGDVYYLSYSAGGEPERIAYCYGPSATGPWTYGGVILDYVDNSKTSHEAIIEFNGNSYMFYHTGALSGGGNYRRSVCVDRLYYNDDGTIKEVIPTTGS